MIDEIKSKFGEQRTENCLSSENRTEFYIAENDQTNRSYIVPDTEESIDLDKCFTVKNKLEKNVSHISIDNCFLTSQYEYAGEKCDFIAFTDEKFCFVELKTNAAKKKQTRKNMKKARNQLGATTDYFDDNEIDFSQHTLEAYIVLKNKLYPTDQASIKERRKKFFDQYEVDLFEESEVAF